MAEAMTYSSLVQSIKDYSERGNSGDVTFLRQLPGIISNTERNLADRLKIQGYLAAYTSTMQAGQAVIAKPENWRSTVSINYGSGPDLNSRVTLRARDLEYIWSLYPVSTQLGSPEFYADYNLQHWFVGPTPADNYPFEAMVYRLPDLLSNQNQQNYLTQYAPFLLLYSCLAEAGAFLKNPEMIGVYTAKAKEQFDAINMEDLQRMVDRGQVRTTT